jgi:hypothetical protein
MPFLTNMPFLVDTPFLVDMPFLVNTPFVLSTNRYDYGPTRLFLSTYLLLFQPTATITN